MEGFTKSEKGIREFGDAEAMIHKTEIRESDWV
jgi:hypothetical protein